MSESKKFKVKYLEENDRRCVGYRNNQGSLELVFEHEVFEKLPPSPPEKGQELFDTIFAINPLTRLPDGDIAVFMNENTSPEVRQYIQQQLMSALPQDAEMPSISDKDMEAFGGADGFDNFRRGENESLSDYRDRVIKFLQDVEKPVEVSPDGKSE